MEKRSDIQIYVLSHKPIDYQREDALYTPLQQGFYPENLWTLRDNTGDNIAEWNGLYAENTAGYWVWKNHPESLRYIGQVQYRRRLEFPENQDFDALFKDYDVITMTPLRLGFSVQDFYRRCHCPDDIERAERIVRELYPDLAGQWDRIMKWNREILYSNGFIMPAEHYVSYYKFLFSVLERFKQERGWDTPEKTYADCEREIAERKRKDALGVKYQAQVFGFLSERLWTFWCLANFPRERILFMDYTKFEGV